MSEEYTKVQKIFSSDEWDTIDDKILREAMVNQQNESHYYGEKDAVWEVTAKIDEEQLIVIANKILKTGKILTFGINPHTQEVIVLYPTVSKNIRNDVFHARSEANTVLSVPSIDDLLDLRHILGKLSIE